MSDGYDDLGVIDDADDWGPDGHMGNDERYTLGIPKDEARRMRQLVKNIGARYSGKSCRMLIRLEMFLCRPFQWIHRRNVKRRFDGNGTRTSEALVMASGWMLDLLSNIYSSRTVGR